MCLHACDPGFPPLPLQYNKSCVLAREEKVESLEWICPEHLIYMYRLLIALISMINSLEFGSVTTYPPSRRVISSKYPLNSSDSWPMTSLCCTGLSSSCVEWNTTVIPCRVHVLILFSSTNYKPCRTYTLQYYYNNHHLGLIKPCKPWAW